MTPRVIEITHAERRAILGAVRNGSLISFGPDGRPEEFSIVGYPDLIFRTVREIA